MVIHVAPHNFFTRVGNDIHCKVEVSFAEAARGCAIRIPTLDGYQMVQSPPGHPNRLVFPVSRGRGRRGAPRSRRVIR